MQAVCSLQSHVHAACGTGSNELSSRCKPSNMGLRRRSYPSLTKAVSQRRWGARRWSKGNHSSVQASGSHYTVAPSCVHWHTLLRLPSIMLWLVGTPGSFTACYGTFAGMAARSTSAETSHRLRILPNSSSQSRPVVPVRRLGYILLPRAPVVQASFSHLVNIRIVAFPTASLTVAFNTTLRICR